MPTLAQWLFAAAWSAVVYRRQGPAGRNGRVHITRDKSWLDSVGQYALSGRMGGCKGLARRKRRRTVCAAEHGISISSDDKE